MEFSKKSLAKIPTNTNARYVQQYVIKIKEEKDIYVTFGFGIWPNPIFFLEFQSKASQFAARAEPAA